MHLLYLHQHFTTPSGSSGTRSYEFSKNLLSRGHEVTVLCGSFGSGQTGLMHPFVNGVRSGKVDGINVIEIEVDYDNSLGFLKRIISFLKFAVKTMSVLNKINNVDLTYATSTPLTIAIPALWAKFFLKIPYVFEVRDLWPELPVAMGVIKNPIIIWGLDMLETMAYKSAVACVGLSPGMVEGIKKKCDASKRVDLIPNGCDLDLFSYILDSDRSSRLSVDHNQRKFIYSGTVGLANDVDSIVRAVSLIPSEKLKNVTFYIVGSGSLKRQLIENVETLGLTRFFVFLDPVSKYELAELFLSMDVGILSLKNVDEFAFGTSPNKFFDYISSGLPVLCNHQGWVADMLGEYQCGFSSDASKDQSFAEAIVEFIESDYNDLLSMSEKSFALAKTFDRKTLASKHSELCEQLLLK